MVVILVVTGVDDSFEFNERNMICNYNFEVMLGAIFFQSDKSSFLSNVSITIAGIVTANNVGFFSLFRPSL